jgi:aspartyl-tRNA(Asn)/glutamyl-tRNA(Gln) amidotransferase subunit C
VPRRVDGRAGAFTGIYTHPGRRPSGGGRNYTVGVSEAHSKPQQLSADYVRKVARLSRLALTDAEVADFQVKLSAVVTYVERLRKLDLSGVEPMANVADSANRLAEDVPGPTLPTETLMRMAPAAMPPFVKVPKVFDEGGGA